jgi:hypothetical protein
MIYNYLEGCKYHDGIMIIINYYPAYCNLFIICKELKYLIKVHVAKMNVEFFLGFEVFYV